MVPFLTGALGVLLLATAQTALSRWMPSALPVLLFPALVAGAVLALPYRPAMRLMLVAAFALELGSGLPAGGAGIALVLFGCLLFAIVRHARLVLPLPLQGLAGAVLTALFLVSLTLAFDRSPWPRPLAGRYVIQRVAVPGIIGGVLTVGVVGFLRRPAGQSLLRALGSPGT